MKKPLFTGTCTALVTPFLDEEVNYPMLEQLLRRQVDAGIEAVVISGTTGEAPTLTDAEKLECFRRAKAYVGDSCKIIAGTGSNSTLHSQTLSRAAEECGVDGLLLVSPYYNKATASGLVTHFTAVAKAVSIPVILYNVPGRTAVDVPVSAYQTLQRIPNITGVKEASADISKITRIHSACNRDFTVWTGNDAMITPAISLGASGVISVLSNIFPEQTQAMAYAALNGDFDTAAALQIQLQPLIDLLFSEVSPIPVKEAMSLMGFDCGVCRLPLTKATDETRKKLLQLLG